MILSYCFWCMKGRSVKVKKRNVYLIFTAFYIYFIMALFESSRGNFIPFFIDEFKINNSTIGLILALNTVGCTIGSFLGGHLCERAGHKLVFVLGTAVSSIAVFMSPFISNIVFLGMFYFIFGIGRSLLSISIDSMIPTLSVGFEVILMNLTHFMYGLGSFSGQSISGKLLSIGLTWRSIYSYAGIFFAVSVIFTLFMKMPNMNVIKDKSSVEKDFYRNPVLFLFVMALSFCMVSENILNTWFINYIRTTYSYNPSEASKYASLFFFLFAAGRLLGGFIINRLGDMRGLKVFMILGAVCVGTGLCLKESGLYLVSMSGFFLSIGFPTLMVTISKTFTKSASLAIGFTTTMGNIVFIVLFYLVGVFNDLVGTYAAFFTAPLSLAACFIMLTLISKKLSVIQK